MTRVTRVAAVALLACGVAACGGGGGSASSPPAVITPAAKVETLFGSKFAMDFEAAPNSEPAAVAMGDIIPVSLTTEPVMLN